MLDKGKKRKEPVGGPGIAAEYKQPFLEYELSQEKSINFDLVFAYLIPVEEDRSWQMKKWELS